MSHCPLIGTVDKHFSDGPMAEGLTNARTMNLSLFLRRSAFQLIALLTACWTAIAWCSAGAEASSIAIEYVADYSRAVVYAPDDYQRFGWLKSNAGVSGTPMANGQDLKRNAWQIADSTIGGTNPNYYHGLNTSDRNASLRDGWRLSTYARYPDQYRGEKPNLGLTAYLRGREYHLMLNLDAAGDLFAMLYDESSTSIRLTSGGTGSAAYHNFELRSAGGTNVVQFYFDGQLLGPTSSWDGRPVANGHDGTIQWGNSLRAGSARGALNVNYVEFAVGPFNSTIGDVDLNGTVDGNDFLWWQRTFNLSHPTYVDADLNDNGVVDAADLAVWKNGFGTRRNYNLVQIPEPSSSYIAWIISLLSYFARSARFKCRNGVELL